MLQNHVQRKWAGRAVICCAIAAALSAPVARAQSAAQPASNASPSTDPLSDWFALIDRMRQSEPGWLPPLITTTPRLSNGLRSDEYFETLGGGRSLNNIGGGKGLQAIVAANTEIDFYAPPYEQRRGPKADANGFGDWPFLTVKYRLLAAPEQDGAYVVSAQLQTVAPTGANPFTNRAYMISPSLAAGKGWGPFDLQANLGEAFPLEHASVIGDATIANLAAQYRLFDVAWPEIELNDTYWSGGTRRGQNQLFVTPALQLGRLPLYGRLKLQLGVGYQYALSPETPSYRLAWVATSRLIF